MEFFGLVTGLFFGSVAYFMFLSAIPLRVEKRCGGWLTEEEERKLSSNETGALVFFLLGFGLMCLSFTSMF